MTPRLRLPVSFALLAVLVSACAGGPPEPTPRPATPRPSPTPEPVYEHPLTGQIYREPQDWQDRRALAIKIGNSAPERPQSGLEVADVVYEELAEGGITRFIAVFHSQESETAGPVRSARFVDPDVLAPMSPLFAYAGAVPPVVAAVRASGSITDVNVDVYEDAYHRVQQRKAPYNLYTSIPELWRRGDGEPPPPLFSWLPEGAGTDPSSGEAGVDVSLSFSPQTSIRFAYDRDSGKYLRFHGGAAHMLGDGTQAAPDNVIVQMVSVRPGSVVDVNGEVSPDSQVLGSGEAVLLRGGRAFRGRWERSGGEPTRFLDDAGAPLLLARGQTYVELVPAGRPVSVS